MIMFDRTQYYEHLNVLPTLKSGEKYEKCKRKTVLTKKYVNRKNEKWR